MGRPKKIKSPEQLMKLFVKYTEWAKANPIKVKDWVGKDGDEVIREKEIPLTFKGFEVWLFENQVINDMGDYEKNSGKRYTKYSPILTHIKRICYTHKFNGAAAGIFNQNIICRELGLMEKTQISGDSENPIAVKITGMRIV